MRQIGHTKKVLLIFNLLIKKLFEFGRERERFEAAFNLAIKSCGN